MGSIFSLGLGFLTYKKWEVDKWFSGPLLL